MHIIRFSHGLANQLFQLCLYRKLEQLYGRGAVFADASWYREHADGHGGFRLGSLCELRYADGIPEGCVHVGEEDPFPARGDERDFLYEGYWQGERFLPGDLGFVEELLRA